MSDPLVESVVEGSEACFEVEVQRMSRVEENEVNGKGALDEASSGNGWSAASENFVIKSAVAAAVVVDEVVFVADDVPVVVAAAVLVQDLVPVVDIFPAVSAAEELFPVGREKAAAAEQHCVVRAMQDAACLLFDWMSHQRTHGFAAVDRYRLLAQETEDAMGPVCDWTDYCGPSA
jgi:hypothetical protein